MNTFKLPSQHSLLPLDSSWQLDLDVCSYVVLDMPFLCTPAMKYEEIWLLPLVKHYAWNLCMVVKSETRLLWSTFHLSSIKRSVKNHVYIGHDSQTVYGKI